MHAALGHGAQQLDAARHQIRLQLARLQSLGRVQCLGNFIDELARDIGQPVQ